jgi:hypothetical protein
VAPSWCELPLGPLWGHCALDIYLSRHPDTVHNCTGTELGYCDGSLHCGVCVCVCVCV